MLVDSHCHLDFPDFAEDLDAVVNRARSAGLGRMVTICTRIRKFEQVVAIAERFDDIFCSVGTHPHNAGEEAGMDVSELLQRAIHPKVVAIGEAGLDYHYDSAPRAAQAEGLRVHIDAARQTGLPLVIHARSADDDMIALLREEYAAGAFPAVLHCFSSGPELAWAGVELGMYVSFSGILTFKNSAEVRTLAAELPMDRLLVETDAPYLAPPPYRGKTNEPSYVVETAKVLADVRGRSYDEICAKTTENFFRLFSKVPPGELLDAAL
jgi:TatD DNase family protein